MAQVPFKKNKTLDPQVVDKIDPQRKYQALTFENQVFLKVPVAFEMLENPFEMFEMFENTAACLSQLSQFNSKKL